MRAPRPDIDDVKRGEFVPFSVEEYAPLASEDDHAVLVGMFLVRRIAAGSDLEVPGFEGSFRCLGIAGQNTPGDPDPSSGLVFVRCDGHAIPTPVGKSTDHSKTTIALRISPDRMARYAFGSSSKSMK